LLMDNHKGSLVAELYNVDSLEDSSLGLYALLNMPGFAVLALLRAEKSDVVGVRLKDYLDRLINFYHFAVPSCKALAPWEAIQRGPSCVPVNDVIELNQYMLHIGLLDFIPIAHAGSIFYRCIKADYKSLKIARGDPAVLYLYEFVSSFKNGRRSPLLLPVNLLAIMAHKDGRSWGNAFFFSEMARCRSTQLPAAAFLDSFADKTKVYSSILASSMVPSNCAKLAPIKNSDTVFDGATGRWSEVFRSYCRDIYGPVEIARVLATHFGPCYNYFNPTVGLCRWLSAPVVLKVPYHQGTAVQHQYLPFADTTSWPANCVMVNPSLGDIMLYMQVTLSPPAAVVLRYADLAMLEKVCIVLKRLCPTANVLYFVATVPHVAIVLGGDIHLADLAKGRLNLERGLAAAVLMYARARLRGDDNTSFVWRLVDVNKGLAVRPLFSGYRLVVADQTPLIMAHRAVPRLFPESAWKFQAFFHPGRFYTIDHEVRNYDPPEDFRPQYDHIIRIDIEEGEIAPFSDDTTALLANHFETHYAEERSSRRNNSVLML